LDWRALDGRPSNPGLFEEALLPHLDGLYGLALRLTRDRDAAADLLQDAVLRAFERFRQLREPAAARAWFVRILTRMFLNRYADRAGDESLPDDGEPLVGESPEAALLRSCEGREIEAALAELPDEFRLAVLLADVEDLPLREIAEICGCPVGTAASRLARGRRRLRDRLAHLRRERGKGA
jgi:RNA polymerase sigma-70 factor (ECF subfamily)